MTRTYMHHPAIAQFPIYGMYGMVPLANTKFDLHHMLSTLLTKSGSERYRRHVHPEVMRWAKSVLDPTLRLETGQSDFLTLFFFALC